MIVREGIYSRLAEALETALGLADGIVWVEIINGETLVFSENFACPDCGISIGEISPRMFSFNNAYGACPECDGLGSKKEVALDLVIPDPTLSIGEGAIAPWGKGSISNYYLKLLQSLAEKRKIDLNIPWQELSQEERELVLYGDPTEKVHFPISIFSERKKRTPVFLRELFLIWSVAMPRPAQTGRAKTSKAI